MGDASFFETAEGKRLMEADAAGWRRWGPYLGERQWGTVREDYSADGSAWSYFPHDHARSRAYRWGEDGIAGFCDDRQLWCLSLGLWNGADPILKERMFGLTNQEGNHGEDVKELWWHLDGTPTHSFQRMLYRYPQRAFPYEDLIRENARRKAQAPEMAEYKLSDTGVLAENRFFDVFVEYAKNATDDILLRVEVRNRGPEEAALHVLPQLVARNTWSWGEASERPSLRLSGDNSVAAACRHLPAMRFCALQPAQFLFCENETNVRRLFGVAAHQGLFKDAINDALTGAAPMPKAQAGTKCAALSRHRIAPGASLVLRYRFSDAAAAELDPDAFDGVVAQRRSEADAFFDVVQQGMENADARLVQRRAFAGMLWSKQFYAYDVKRWLDGDPNQPAPPAARCHERNADWTHLDNAAIVSMPDKWEYPWYASWDLALQAVAFAAIDPAFAKGQLLFLTRDWSMHPSGQLPAFEWDFDKANPPVQAFAALKVFQFDAALTGKPDHAFLARMLQKLSINFTWWVNRKDAAGRNLFQGGFLGLDNIGIFDRSEPMPGGGTMEQADGTAWMAMYALNLMRMALILAETDPVHEDLATKFFEHFLLIASAMTHLGGSEAEKAAGAGLWDEKDGFFYDALVLPDGRQERLRLRSLVGLIPLCAVEVLEPDLASRHPGFAARLQWLMEHRPDLTSQVSRFNEPGSGDRLLLSLLRRHRTGALLSRMLDEGAFLSPFGIRSLSKEYGASPFRIDCGGTTSEVAYEPGNSRLQLFGGNSNWRGPVWMPINFLLVEALREFDRFYGATFSAECPAGSGNRTTLGAVADEIARRLCSLFLAEPDGRRPALGSAAAAPAEEPLIAFHEFFHGETGEGLGASHQTGWTSLVALLLFPKGASVP